MNAWRCSARASLLPLTQSRLPYPQWSYVYSFENLGFSSFEGLQLEASHRFRGDFFFQASYVVSKNLGLTNVSDGTFAPDFAQRPVTDRYNTRYNRGNLGGSRRQHFLLTGLFPLPFGKGRQFLNSTNGFASRLVGGWEISGIWSLQSGFALPWNNMIYYGDPKNILLPIGERSADRWFNATDFETASTKQLLSNQLRTWPFRFPTLRGPRQNNVDFALIKQTRINEGCSIEFRAEALNAANHPLFPNPNMTATAPNIPNKDNTGLGQISASTMKRATTSTSR